MKITNYTELATTKKRADGLTILNAGLEAIDTRTAVARVLSVSGTTLSVAGETFDTSAYGRVRVVGAGKCSADAVNAIAETLGGLLTDGFIIDTHERPVPNNVILRVGGHPLPDKRNVAATAELLSFLDGGHEDDLIICLVSGGGSALLTQPPEGMTFTDEASIVKSLMSAGATIQETNIVRKHLSFARGGRLAERAFPARVVALIFSDVPGDDIAFISSGPTVQDITSIADARAVLAKYGIPDTDRFLLETPKEEKFFKRVSNSVIVSNTIALEAMRERASELGYTASIVTSTLVGEARDASRNILSQLHEGPENSALLFGGETTVSSGSAHGAGGRNQEAALAGLSDVREDELLIACASDGRDNTDVAGAVCDAQIAAQAAQRNLLPREFLERHDSYGFFKAVGGHIVTGDTESNVSDLIIALK